MRSCGRSWPSSRPNARMAPEALDGLTPEERRQFHKMLRHCVVVQPDGTIYRGERRVHRWARRMYLRNDLTMLWPPHTQQWAGVCRDLGWAKPGRPNQRFAIQERTQATTIRPERNPRREW